MKAWTVERCGKKPQELQLVSPDTYIQRKDIKKVDHEADRRYAGLYRLRVHEPGDHGIGIPDAGKYHAISATKRQLTSTRCSLLRKGCFNMSILVNSLTRLYESGRLTKEQIKERVENGSINEEEYQEITGEAYES